MVIDNKVKSKIQYLLDVYNGKQEVRAFYELMDLSTSPSDEDVERIKEIESDIPNIKVVAVINSISSLGGENVPMTCYVYFEGDDDAWAINDSVIGCFAFVVNKAWDIEEYGSIGITINQHPNTKIPVIKRVM